MALADTEATETTGEVYGFSLVYSGNFSIEAEVDCYETTRVLVGIHPADFNWHLEVGESFWTPGDRQRIFRQGDRRNEPDFS